MDKHYGLKKYLQTEATTVAVGAGADAAPELGIKATK